MLHSINSVIADPADSFAVLGPTLQAIDTGDILDVSLSEVLAELEQDLEQTLVEEGRGDGIAGDRDNEREDELQVLAGAVQGVKMGEEGRGGALHEGGDEVGEEERGDEEEDLAEAVQGTDMGEEGQGGALQAELGHDRGDGPRGGRGDEEEVFAVAVQGANMGSRVRIQSLEGTPVSGRIVDLSFPSVGVVTR